MKRVRFILSATAVTTLCLVCASMTQAQSVRTWVSGTGDDVNPCSRSAPCRTFAGALSKTAEAGEISVLNPGSYGTVTINKAVTINGNGALAGINAAGATGVTVNVTTNPETATVILREIAINGMQTGSNGIRYLAGKTLMVDHCWIHSIGSGIGISADLAANGNLKVIDTVIEDIRFGIGIVMTSDARSELLATIDGTRIMNCSGAGIVAQDHVRAAINNSIITHNLNGILTTPVGTDSLLNVDHVAISYCPGTALSAAGSGSEIRVSDSMIAQNATGVSGNVRSFQGNSLMGNTNPGTFVTTTAKQ